MVFVLFLLQLPTTLKLALESVQKLVFRVARGIVPLHIMLIFVSQEFREV